MHVLIIDDERDFLSLMEKRLARRNMQVTTADNAKDGLAHLADTSMQIDVTLLDVRMPEMDGLEALHRIKQIRPHLPVILLTGHANLEVAVTGMELGAFDYLLKPVAINELIIKLEDAARSAE